MMQDQSFMAIACSKIHTLESLTPDQINELSNFLNIKSLNIEHKCNKIKESIRFILLIERQKYEDYLNLPKFKMISHGLYTILSKDFKDLWEQFGKERRLSIHQPIFPSGTNTLNCHNPFQNPFQLQSSKLMQYSMPPNLQPYFLGYNYMIPPSIPQQNNFMKINPLNTSNPLNAPFNSTGQNMQPLSSQSANLKQFKKQHQSQQCQSVQIKMEEQLQQPYMEQSQEEYNIQVSFLQCPCEGITDDDQSFKCSGCGFWFHYNCLRMVTKDDKSCPFCMIAKCMFTKLYARPIFKRWIQLQDLRTATKTEKIELSDDQIKLLEKCLAKISEEETYFAELHILKIRQNTNNINKSTSSKVSFPLNKQQLVKMKNRKQFDISFNHIFQNNSLVYCTLVCLYPKTAEQIINCLQTEKVQKRTDFILRKIIRQDKQEVEINLMHPTTKKLIEIPVRMDKCQHNQCEDFMYIFNKFQVLLGNKEKIKLNCTYCSKPYNIYSNFNIDNDLLVFLKQQSTIEPNPFTMIKYERQGKISWVKASESDQQPILEPEDQSSPI